MQFSTKATQPERVSTGALMIFAYLNGQLSKSAELVDKAAQGAVAQALSSGDITCKPGSSLVLRQLPGIAAQRVIVVGLGDRSKLNARVFLESMRDAFKAVRKTAATQISLGEFDPVEGVSAEELLTFSVLAARESAYQFDRFKTDKTATAKAEKSVEPKGFSKVEFLVDKSLDKAAKLAVQQAVALANGIELTKDLGNLPGNVCTPSYLAEVAKQLAKEFEFKVTVLGRKQIEALRMGSFLSVANGSDEPCKFIVMEYLGGAKTDRPVVLVGKGVTFDSGGISLKPGADMDEMKFDMCGAASVLGTFRALVEMKLPLNVVGLIPATENLPSGKATKPGDIVTSMSGKTIEVLNTDAEGRLILCDALTYAERYQPQVVIDIATLTGACVVALGAVNSGLFSANDALADELIQAGRRTLDPCWRLPLEEDYQELLKSPFADVANIGGRWAGAVTAACFLARFTEKYNWAHLDIAGTAWRSGANKGATGRPVSLLVDFLRRRAKQVVR